METYIVTSGNWKARIDVEDDDEFSYIEAGTRAIEAVFGMRELGEGCEVISLLDEKKRDYFNPNEQFEDDKPPVPLFSVVTNVYKESDEKKATKYVLFRTIVLFENASQPINVELARKAEEESPEIVKEALKMTKEINKRNKKKS